VIDGWEEEVLSVDRVSLAFAGRPVLEDVSFSLGGGAFCGLIGANGSGKTTLLRAILGFETPARGSIRIDRAGGDRRLLSVGYVPQKIALDPFMPLRARDVVALGLDGHRFGLPLPSRQSRSRVDAMLKAVDAERFADQRIGTLSGGYQQRVLIAHALVRQPRLLLLDEPLASLDLRSSAEIVTLLRRFATVHRIAVLLSAHDINPLLGAMDQIVYLANGRAASGATDEVIRTEVLSRLYGYHIDVIRVHGRILVIASDSPGKILTEIAEHPEHVAAVP